MNHVNINFIASGNGWKKVSMRKFDQGMSVLQGTFVRDKMQTFEELQEAHVSEGEWTVQADELSI